MNVEQSARKVVTRSPRRKVGIINCRWFQRESVEHESQLEKRFIQCVLLCPRLIHIKSQPFKLDIGETRPYTPDFLLTFEDGSQLVVEVKIAKRTAQHIEKFRIAQTILDSKSIMFFVLTEQQIDRRRQSEIAAEILRYAKSEFSETLLKHVMDVMASQVDNYLMIKELALLCDCSCEVIFHLVALRRLTLHADDHFNANARVNITQLHKYSGSDVNAFIRHFDLKSWLATGAEEENMLSAPTQKRKKNELRKRVKLANTPFIRSKLERQNQSIPHPLNSLAGGLPHSVERRRPGFHE